MTRIDRRSVSLLGLATILSPASAFAADYPSRPIHLIVGFTPGAEAFVPSLLAIKKIPNFRVSPEFHFREIPADIKTE